MNDYNDCCRNNEDFNNLVGMVWDVLKYRLENRSGFDRLEYRRYAERTVEVIAWHDDGTGYGVTISPYVTIPTIMLSINECVNDFI